VGSAGDGLLSGARGVGELGFDLWEEGLVGWCGDEGGGGGSCRGVGGKGWGRLMERYRWGTEEGVGVEVVRCIMREGALMPVDDDGAIREDVGGCIDCCFPLEAGVWPSFRMVAPPLYSPSTGVPSPSSP
jgi:hypothetical protein